MRFTALVAVLLITGCQSYTIAPEVSRINNAAVREAYKACSIEAQLNGSDEAVCRKAVIADLINFGNQVLENAKCVKQYQVKSE